MNSKLVVTLIFNILFTSCIVCGQKEQSTFDKTAFYKVMESDNEIVIDKQIEEIKGISFYGKTAFEGALLMKKAAKVKAVKKKLAFFKDGQKKLESMISSDSLNVEFRFLRLIIQENSPAILGYKKEMAKDNQHIRTNYNKLPPTIKKIIVAYSHRSAILKISDL